MSRRRALLALAAAGALGLCAGAPAAAQDNIIGYRVVGGRNAKAYPFQVGLEISLDGVRAYCAGTLIAPDWVLTAGHCTRDMDGRDFPASAFLARIGGRLFREGEVHKIVRVVTHEAFDVGAFVNDIALLQLDLPSRAPPVALEGVDGAEASREDQTFATVIGWGRTTRFAPEQPIGVSPDQALQEAELPLVGNAQCNRLMNLPKEGPIDDRRICAGKSEGGVDSCNGDSGGPLLVHGSGRWVEVGIVSYGANECGAQNHYGVYTRVAAFAPWIVSHAGLGATAQQGRPPPLSLGALSAAPTLLSAALSPDSPVKIDIPNGRALRDGQRFRIRVSTQVGGYLALFDIDDANTVCQLLPDASTAVYHGEPLRPGASILLPDSTYGGSLRASLRPDQTAARGRLLAVVVQDPAMLRPLVGQEAQCPEADKSIFGRLEVVLKAPAPAGTPAGRWAAGLVDYTIDGSTP